MEIHACLVFVSKLRLPSWAPLPGCSWKQNNEYFASLWTGKNPDFFLSWDPFSSPQFTHPCGIFSSGGRLQIWPKHLFNQPAFLYSGSYSIILPKISDLIDDILTITASYILASPPWGYFGIRVSECSPDNANPIYYLFSCFDTHSFRMFHTT